MRESQVREFLDAIVRKKDRRKSEHVDLPELECVLGFVLFVGDVPVLNHARAADRGEADLNVPGNLGLLGEVREDAGDPHMKAVPAREDTLALGDRLCQLFGRMIDLPKGWPLMCHDLKQYSDDLKRRFCLEQIPRCSINHGPDEHHARADARWDKTYYEELAVLDARLTSGARA